MATLLLPTLLHALTPALAQALADAHALPHVSVQRAHESWMALLAGALAHHGIAEGGAQAVRHLFSAQAMQAATEAAKAFNATPGPESLQRLAQAGHSRVTELLGAQRVSRVTLALAAVSGLGASTAQGLAWVLSGAGLAALAPVLAQPLRGDDAALLALLRAQGPTLDRQLDARLTTAAGLGSPSALLASLQASPGGMLPGLARRDAGAAPGRRWWLGGLGGGVALSVVTASQLATCDSHDRLSDALPGANHPQSANSRTGAASAAQIASLSSQGLMNGAVNGAMSVQVFFEVGQSLIGNEGQQRLASVRAWLVGDASRQVAVTGYTDTSGDPELNQALAHARALGVRRALQDAGIAASRIVVRPPETLALPASAPAAQARRVDIVGL